MTISSQAWFLLPTVLLVQAAFNEKPKRKYVSTSSWKKPIYLFVQDAKM